MRTPDQDMAPAWQTQLSPGAERYSWSCFEILSRNMTFVPGPAQSIRTGMGISSCSAKQAPLPGPPSNSTIPIVYPLSLTQSSLSFYPPLKLSQPFFTLPPSWTLPSLSVYPLQLNHALFYRPPLPPPTQPSPFSPQCEVCSVLYATFCM